MEGGLLSLKWNDHSHTFFDMLSTIRRRESYCDVTLVCEGRFYPVHKLVLSTCSEFFDNLFSKTDCKHPVVIVANVSHKDLESLFNYMYLGEVNVLQTELGSLMRAAEVLRIKGLAEPTKPQEKELKNKLPHPTSSKSSGSSPKRKAGDHDTVSPPSKRSSPIKERPERRNPSDPLVASKEKDPLVSPLNNSPEAASSNERLSVRDTKSSQLEPGVSLLVADEEQDSSERAEVKMEEISIKNEPGSWFEESSDNAPYSEQDSTYNYNQQTVNYPGSCVPWAVSPVAQPNPVESHLPQGVPGASGLQGPGSSSDLDESMADYPVNFEDLVSPPDKDHHILEHPLRLRQELDHSLEPIPESKFCHVCLMDGQRRNTTFQCVTCCMPLCAGCSDFYHGKDFGGHVPAVLRRMRVPDPPTRLNKDCDHSLQSLPKRKRCRVCHVNGIRRNTSYQCYTCHIPLCRKCTSIYHSNRQYWES